MAYIDGGKYKKALVIDLTDVQDDLVDLAPGALKGARAEKEGLKEVLIELEGAIPAHGEKAEIHAATYARVLTATEKINQLRVKEAALLKGLEVVRESRGRLENNREDDLSSIGAQAEEKGTRGKQTELLAHFEKTIKYKSQTADKAAETRRKNEEARTAGEAKGGGQDDR